jgi:outer membrane protein
MGAEYQQKLADAQAKEPTMTNTEREVAARELGELEQRIQQAQAKAQEDLSAQEEELLKPMVEQTNTAIKTVAEENGFTYVLDTSAGFVLYYDRGEDLLAKVKSKMGIQ